MSDRIWPPVAWSVLWLILMAVTMATRPLLPVDETRYLAVAWEMWRDSSFLVPHLNGETYSHKPPLLFWLMHLGWGLFGVNEVTPRLVAPLFGLGSLFVAQGLARKLWPDRPDLPRAAGLILFGCLFWTLFTTLTMFDMMLAFFTLAGLAGLVHAWKTGGWLGFLALGLGIGFGILTKGPAILLLTLPAALLAPYWGPALTGGVRPVSWAKWYAGVASAVLFGAAIGLAWAVPAAIAGGEAYRDAIFWGQSAGRMVDSFAHSRPWWWYLAVLLPLILPWSLWPALWRSLRHLPGKLGDGGVRFCIAWFLPAFLAFSLISGKQPHYLLPIFPALAFVMARLVENTESRRLDRVIAALPAALFGGVLFLLPFVSGIWNLPPGTEDLDTTWSALALGAAFAVMVLPQQSSMQGLVRLSALSAVIVATVHLSAAPLLDKTFDLTDLSRQFGVWEREGYTLAHYGKYHGQFHFLGRLKKPLKLTGDGEIADWLASTTKGKVITYQKRLPDGGMPDYVQPFRRKIISVWDAETVRRNPKLAKRH